MARNFDHVFAGIAIWLREQRDERLIDRDPRCIDELAESSAACDKPGLRREVRSYFQQREFLRFGRRQCPRGPEALTAPRWCHRCR